MLSTALWLVKL